MAREDMIRDAMRTVDTYNEIYEPTIKALAKTERQLSRAEKEWRKQGGQMVARMTNKAGAEYMAKDPVLVVRREAACGCPGIAHSAGPDSRRAEKGQKRR